MAVTDALEAKAHHLIGQLQSYPDKLAAVVHLLELMVQQGEDRVQPEPVSQEDLRRYPEGQTSVEEGKGIPMAEVLTDFGLTLEDFPSNA